jgi:hypothetical protein
MGKNHSRAALRAEHKQLQQQTEELKQEHQRLRSGGATREQRDAHRIRLRDKRMELEQHFTRLRQLEQQRHQQRQQALADELDHPRD